MIAYKKLACFIKVINKIRRLKKAIKSLNENVKKAYLF